MLKKLFRQEFKSKSSMLLLFCEILVVATVLMSVVTLVDKYVASRLSEIIYAIVFIGYVGTIIVLIIAWFIYLCVYFYQTMYSTQGYLTHTLPVKSSDILNVKVMVSLIQLVIVPAVAFISFIVVGLVQDGINIGELMDAFRVIMQNINEYMGIPGHVFVVFFVVMVLMGCLDALLLFFAGSSLGQLFHRSKGAWGIAASIGIYYISQIVTIIIIACAGSIVYIKNVEMMPASAVYLLMSGAVALAVFWAVVYYVISRVIVLKHLNLE